MKKKYFILILVLLILFASCANNDSKEEQYKEGALYMLNEAYSLLSAEAKESLENDIADIKEEIYEAEDEEDAEEILDEATGCVYLYMLFDGKEESEILEIFKKTIKKYPKTKEYFASYN